ncbi:hypothetical protein [Vulcanisaeta souniana]|uniref:hypothetical protein n=1 Tax=Vulcanisaeta souniana TaxID=164452 RepID=UPI000A4D67A7|nr:hypothetical protein [Vulcanisaeta souniana]
MRSARVLITGIGGIGGVNFVNALRLAERQVDLRLYLVGTDHNPYYIHFANVDARYRTPRHDDPTFLSTLLDIIKRHGIEFLHPHPSVDANVVASNRGLFDSINVRAYLPSPESIAPPDKALIADKMIKAGVPAPRTMSIKVLDDIDEAFSRLGSPLWIRARRGAGGRLSLRVNNPEEAKLWVRLNVLQSRASIEDFIIQEYLPGRDVAFDSLWYRGGRLITSYARERIEYPFKHISLSGITGTPSVARTISDEEVNKVGVRAVLALDPEPPHGFYSVDLKEDLNGRFRVPRLTVSGTQRHRSGGLSMARAYQDPRYNLAYVYLALGMWDELPWDLPQYDLFPSDHYLIRQMDSGVLLMRGRMVTYGGYYNQLRIGPRL